MSPFSLFFERKQRNPLRKKTLSDSDTLDYLDPEFIEQYKNYYKLNSLEDIDDLNDQSIKRRYDNLLKTSENLANAFLDSEINAAIKNLLRQSTKGYRKVYEYQGVKVFLDEKNVTDTDYSIGSPNYQMVKRSVLVMLVYVRDVLPNRKPKIIITSLSKHPYTKRNFDYNEPSAGMAGDKFIYIDENYIEDNAVWVHEYAHWVADLIPTQTQKMLMQAFKKFISIYYKKVKTKKPNRELTPQEKLKIAEKLGFPEYGLTDHNEFFAVLIENWKQLPRNKLTYKFKSLVKTVLTRL